MATTRARRSTTTPSEPMPATASTVSLDDVARRAYDRFVSRSGEHGHDVDDWLSAERELLVGQVSTRD